MKPRLHILAFSIAGIAMSGCADIQNLLEKDDSSASSGTSATQQERRDTGQTPRQEQPAADQNAPAMAADEQLLRKVQEQLQAKGIEAGPIDGIWGPMTSQGVREFQEKQGLQASGQLDARTLAALGVDASASAGGTQSANQRDQQGAQSKLFERVDKDDDGAVSRAEFDATLGAERSRPEQARGAPRFQSLDANDDGYVSLAEAGADTRISRDFKRADQDKDGRLSQNEFRDALQMGQGAGRTASANGRASTGSSLPEPRPTQRVPIEDRDKLFRALDRNGDGGVSKAEAAGDLRVIRDFERADADGNGRLDRAEMNRVIATGEPSRYSSQ